MNEFKVIEIIDADIIQLHPDFLWVNRDGVTVTGNSVKISGFVLPLDSTQTEFIKVRLRSLLINNYITLTDAKDLPNNEKAKIECKVLLNGVDIMIYFPEFKRDLTKS